MVQPAGSRRQAADLHRGHHRPQLPAAGAGLPQSPHRRRSGGDDLLAAVASFGVLAAVFQYGWGLHALGLGQPGPVESFLPVLMLAVLFGLSMDYEVFLVSRIREEWAAH